MLKKLEVLVVLDGMKKRTGVIFGGGAGIILLTFSSELEKLTQKCRESVVPTCISTQNMSRHLDKYS